MKAKVNYSVKWLPRRFWFHCWLPRWHDGRGRYLSVGAWVVAFYRGY